MSEKREYGIRPGSRLVVAEGNLEADIGTVEDLWITQELDLALSVRDDAGHLTRWQFNTREMFRGFLRFARPMEG